MITSLLFKFKNHHLAGLYRNFKDAQHILKQIFISRKKTAQSLPWYVIMGPTHSGKTTLLERADLEYISSERLIHKTSPQASGVSYVNWWVTRKAVFLDVPGYYLNEDENTASLFPALLKLIRKKNKLAGVIFTIDFSQLLFTNKTKQQALFQQIKKSTAQLTHLFQKPFLIYLAITKMDRIVGFKDFFADLGSEERSQPWGISFPVKLGGSLDLAHAFNHEFETLLKRINERLIWRLHHERNVQKRRAIHHFPLQIESLKASLSQLIYQLNEHLRYNTQTQLRGVYFISGSQQGDPIDCVYPQLANHFELLPAHLTPHAVNDQGYFIRDFLKETIFSPVTSSTEKKQLPSYHPRNYRIVIACAIGAIVLTAAGGLVNYHQKTQALRTVKEVMASYHQAAKNILQTQSTLSDLLPSLENLRLSLHALQQTSLPTLLHTQKQQQQTLMNNAKQLYQQALQTKFLPALTKLIEQQLQNTPALDAAEAYSTLKAYVMLSDTQHLQPHYLLQWISRHQASLLPLHPELEKTLETLLMEALAVRTTSSMPLNSTLIINTRHALTMMPEPLLAYLMLKNNYTPQQTTPAFSPLQLSPVASIYNPVNFEDVYNIQIPATVQEVKNGNWVIGNKAPLKKQDAKYLTQEVRDLFIGDYAHQWEHALTHLTLPEVKDLSEVQQLLQQLAHPSSPLIKIPSLLTTTLNLAHRNDKLNTLSPLLPTAAQQQTLLTLLRQLHVDINKIMLSESTDTAAFQIAKTYAENEHANILVQLQNKAKDMPPPVRDILQQLSQQTWKMILALAHQHVNSQWQTTLLPVYRDQIENRYPLVSNAEKEISLSHFQDFFAPQGLLDKFFITYLKPFVNTEGALWQWKKIEGATLGQDQQILVELERASLIRTMFFGKGIKILVPFSLQPLAIQTNLRNFQLQLNGQSAGNFDNPNRSHHLEWPGTGKSHLTLHFEDAFGQTTHKTLAGPWAWFKLLQQSTLQQLNDTQHFELTLDINNHAAKYQLVADNAINPFISGIIEQFRSPNEI